MQGSALGTGSIQDVLRNNTNVRTAVIGYAIAPDAQSTSGFTASQNISTTAAQNMGGGSRPLSISVQSTSPLRVRRLGMWMPSLYYYTAPTPF